MSMWCTSELSGADGNVAKQVPEMLISANGREVARVCNKCAAFEVLDCSRGQLASE